MKKEKHDNISLTIFSEIVMGFWENITGFTFDGLPADNMPENVKLVYSIKNHIKQLINLSKGTTLISPDKGIEDIPDVLTSLPSWTQDFGKSLKSMIMKYDERIKEIYFNNWCIEGKQRCLTCILIIITENEEVIRYRAIFSTQGNRRVEIITGEDED